MQGNDREWDPENPPLLDRDTYGIFYRGREIEQKASGWWVSFFPNIGYLKADTYSGIKQIIDEYLEGGEG